MQSQIIILLSAWLITAGMGCATGSPTTAQRRMQSDLATPYAGALQQANLTDAASGAFAEVESGQGAARAEADFNLGFYIYVAIGIVLALYLIVLLFRRARIGRDRHARSRSE